MKNKEVGGNNLNIRTMPRRSLIIIGGTVLNIYFKEMVFYDIDTDTIYRTVPLPIKSESRIIQKSELVGDKIYTLFCYESMKENNLDRMELYCYDIKNDKWKLIPVSNNLKPRTGHTFVYNKATNTFYLFGGLFNEERHNELWKLRVKPCTKESLFRKIKFILTKHRFLRLVNKDLEKAIDYLQTKVFENVDHGNIDEERVFKELCFEIYKEGRDLCVDEIVEDICVFFKEEVRPCGRNIDESM